MDKESTDYTTDVAETTTVEENKEEQTHFVMPGI